jgi:hypothetical protein
MFQIAAGDLVDLSATSAEDRKDTGTGPPVSSKKPQNQQVFQVAVWTPDDYS